METEATETKHGTEATSGQPPSCEPLTPEEKQFLRERLSDQDYLANLQLEPRRKQAVNEADREYRLARHEFYEVWEGAYDPYEEPVEHRLMNFVYNLIIMNVFAVDELKIGKLKIGVLMNLWQKLIWDPAFCYALLQYMTLLMRRKGRIVIDFTEEDVRFLNECIDYTVALKRECDEKSKVFTFDVNEWYNSPENQKRLETDTNYVKKLEAHRLYKVEHELQRNIAQQLGVKQSTITKYVAEIEGAISYNLGHTYEEHFAKYMWPEFFTKYAPDAGRGKPDGIGYLADGTIQVCAVKCYCETRSSITLPRIKLRPEIEETKRRLENGENVQLRLFLREHTRGYETNLILDPSQATPITVQLPPTDTDKDKHNGITE